MCIICTQWEMYKDVEDVIRMVRKAREERYPIPEKHLAEIEATILPATSELADPDTDNPEWNMWAPLMSELDDELGGVD